MASSSAKSVLFINRVYPPARGATGRMLRDLARGMADAGWDVTVLCAGPEKKSYRDGKVNVVCVKGLLKSKNIWAYLLILFKLFFAGVRLPAPHLLVSMTDPPFLLFAGRALAVIKKCRHVHWCQDMYPDLLPMAGLSLPQSVQRFLKKHARQSMKKCDKVVVIGRCMAKQITHGGVEPSRVSVIPNWPDFEVLDPNKAGGDHKPFLVKTKGKVRPPEEQRRDDSPKFRILYAGNLGRIHPVGAVLDAASFVQEKYPEIEFVFVGDGPNYERLAAERAKRGLSNIRLLPYQPANRLRDVLESGDVHLVTMHEDAEGLLVPCKFYSALAVGRPCIFMGPEGSEIARVVKDFEIGKTIPPRNAAKLVEAIMLYRNDADNWFNAQKAAEEAGKIFVAEQSIKAWIKRAEDSLTEPI
jgi:colanic acid biosynthesis glycosyl transferase WcaI